MLNIFARHLPVLFFPKPWHLDLQCSFVVKDGVSLAISVLHRVQPFAATLEQFLPTASWSWLYKLSILIRLSNQSSGAWARASLSSPHSCPCEELLPPSLHSYPGLTCQPHKAQPHSCYISHKLYSHQHPLLRFPQSFSEDLWSYSAPYTNNTPHTEL